MAVPVVARWLAFVALVLIAAATLVPISLRPHVADTGIEHFVAFALLGFLFALGFPRRTLVVVVLVVSSAALLEVLQTVDPTRHAEWIDFVVKAGGGLVGVAIGAGAPRKPGQR